MFGLDLSVIKNIKKAIALFSQIEKVTLYGSRAKGNYRHGSDIDITLIGKDLSLNNSVYPLIDKLDDLYLPYTFDISIFNHIDNDDLIEHILTAGKVFYEKEKVLPKGWKVKKLEEIETIEFLRGSGLPKSALSDSGKSECIHYGQLYTTYKYPVIRKVVFRTNIEGKKLSSKGDVLIPGTTTADAMGIAIARSLNKNNVVIGGDINILRTKNIDVLSDFLSYYLNGPAKVELASYANGTNILHLSNKKIKKISIPIPSLSEQKHIVVILDKTFAEIAKAETIAKTNLQNAKELFESYLNNIFTRKSNDWGEKKWGDLCHFVRGPFGGSLKKSMFVKDGYVVYEQKHAIHNHFNQLRYFVNEDKFNEMKRFEVMPGDIIMSCSGVTLGRVAVIPKNIKKGIINQALLKLTPNELINVDFLKHWLRSNIFQKIIFEHSGGAAIPNVPAAKIMKEIMIPVPSIEKQLTIIRDIESTLIETKKLEKIYQQKIVNLEEFKKSFLQKAFNGEL
ncbi:restriction endonuclease subunit S [Bathymodiolus thermophilus thioautotrophic gill symbiont]|uniref:Restriction endonuclease subunit S n=1 Tax=Bathymodiolus thermophilus thioautotrophic gill symbiont TaxID=2360 RepID=A0A1J5TWT0_9GAMM|nr:restriction endonuclease subunit S [Bathymodiolus thermophilus thioautotrophic gill symbiont]OIR25291.1 hypothetical protein BGC33_06060 [Bathymodiolus thermophilus thioautotrophic gill symbiont]